MGRYLKGLVALGGLLIHTSIVIASESSTTLYKRTQNDTPCNAYLIQGEDSCASIAKSHSITTADIEKYNSKTYAWNGCGNMRQGDFICVSSGVPPMPAALPNAVCGPQVPGTAPPTNPKGWSNIGSLNPCPAGQCCNQGQCQPGAESCGAAVGPAAAITTTTKALSTSYTTKRITVDTSKDSTTETTTKKMTSTTTTTTNTKSKTTTTKSKTTTSEEPEKTSDSFSIAFYEYKNCSGNYFVVEGHHRGSDAKCLGINSGIPSISTDTNTWCRCYTDGDFDYTDCNSATSNFEFGAINIASGYCSVFPTEDCQINNGMFQGYGSNIHHGFHAVDDKAPQILGGLKCYNNF